jgi:hypothetical protein
MTTPLGGDVDSVAVGAAAHQGFIMANFSLTGGRLQKRPGRGQAARRAASAQGSLDAFANELQ